MSDRLDMEHMEAEIKRLRAFIADLERRLSMQQAQVDALEAESGESMSDTLLFMEQRENVGKFAGKVLAEARSWMADISGGDIEDWALKYGLLETFNATEPCSTENCNCAEVGDFPMDCHRYSPLGVAITKDFE